jgi:cyclopropane fatty-acyl-phospholipid synthase-like methyltransferase
MGGRVGEFETANPDQLAAWDGDEGDHWAEHEERYNHAVLAHSVLLLRRAAIGSTEDVLDLGCGCGETTRDAARTATDGSALGIDLSSRMIERARVRAAEEDLASAVR